MKKIKMARGTTLTFEENCNKYLEYCQQNPTAEAVGFLKLGIKITCFQVKS